MDLRRVKKLNEEMRQILNEIDIDPSFKDYIDTRREYQKNKDKKDVDRYKKTVDAYPEDNYWKKEYEKALNKYMGKHEADDILKTIYDKCHINLEQGGIKEIPIPKNINELKKQVTPNESAIILKKGDYISVIQGSYSDNKVILYASYSDNKNSFRDVAYEPVYHGKELDLTKPNSLSRAINQGLFDKAWLVYGGSTTKMSQDRKAAYFGSKDDLRNRNSYWNNKDKSGYLKRDLKQELAKLTRDAKRNDFEKVKQTAVELRKELINKIKQNDIEDISTKDLEAVVMALKKVENTYFDSYGNSDDIKISQNKLTQNIDQLKNIIDTIN